MNRVRRRVTVSGRVQGVGFRWACQQMAAEAGVSGWCRNLPDGRVEAAFEGDPEAVERALAWIRHGPAHARVTATHVVSEAVEGATGFWLS